MLHERWGGHKHSEHYKQGRHHAGQPRLGLRQVGWAPRHGRGGCKGRGLWGRGDCVGQRQGKATGWWLGNKLVVIAPGKARGLAVFNAVRLAGSISSVQAGP